MHILSIAGFVLAIAGIASSLFLRRLTAPITRLAETAAQIGRGNLTAKTDIRRDDEIGVLAGSFNAMVDRLRDQIQNMESRVAERTEELNRSVQNLERRNQESVEINRMGELLQSCHSEEEVFTVAARTGHALFPEHSGRIHMVNDHQGLTLVAEWGTEPPVPTMDESHTCWTVRHGQPHQDPPDCEDSLCPHCCEPGGISLCIPLLAEGTVTGVIKVNSGAAEADMDQAVAERKSLLITMAEQVAMAVTNLRLREQLRQQAIKDPLTGLYNRRRLEETLQEELSWAERHDGTVGVIMLDVDHFKQLNDTHGHETGDAVLRELGGLLNRSLRREDRAFRYGGEEFTLVILKTNAKRLCRLAELVRVRVEEELNLSLFTESTGKETVSLGAAQFPDHARDLHGLLQAADRALYLAKHRGRNRVAFAAKAASEE